MMMESRRRKLIDGDNAKLAIELLSKATGKEPGEPFTGQEKFDVEILRGMFLKLTVDELNKLVVPAVKACQ